MIKLKSLNVKNYKSLIDTKIEDFGDVNMFYGFNNSGKSNVFKFLQLLFTKKKEIQSVEVKDEDSVVTKKATTHLVSEKDFWNGYIYNEPFIFSNNERSSNITFEVTLLISNDILPERELLMAYGFVSDEASTQLYLKGEIEALNSKDSKLNVVLSKLNNQEFYFFEDEIDYGFREIDPSSGLTKKVAFEILQLMNNCVEYIDSDRGFAEEILQEDQVELSHKSFKNWLFDLNMDAEKNDVFQNLASFLADFDFTEEAKDRLSNNIKSFPFREFTDIGFTKFGENIEIMLKNGKNRLPLSSFGTGIQQFFYILTRVFMNNSKIIIVEELELNLSPLYQKELMTFLKSLLGAKFDQLLFSSHSPFFTLRDSSMVDFVQHVQIDNRADTDGTDITSYDEWDYDENQNISIFSFCYS